MLNLPEPSSGSLIDDAVLVRTTPKKKLGEPCCANSTSSIAADAEGDPHAKDKKASVIETRRAHDSRPRGDHIVFTHFPTYPKGNDKDRAPDAKN